MRSLPTLRKASISASTLLIVFAGLSPAALASDDPVSHQSPNLILGAGVGYAYHWGQSYDVDAVSGASAPPVKGSGFTEHGIAMNAFADFAAIDLGRGNLGVQTGFTLTAPKTFMNFALEPRYRLRFPLTGGTVRSIEPWAGLGVAFAFREKIDRNYYLLLVPLSIGCDLALGSERLYAGVAAHLNYGNPKGVKNTVLISDQPHQYDVHMDNLEFLVRLSYLVF